MSFTQRRLFSAGLGLLAIGLLLALASGLLGVRAGSDGGAAAPSSPATAGAVAPGSGRPGSSPTVGGTSGPGSSSSEATGTPPPGGGVSPNEGSTTGGSFGGLTTSGQGGAGHGTITTAGAQTPGSGSVPRGDPVQRLAQAARDAGYTVLRLDDSSWSLGGVEVGIFGRQVYIDSVYRRDTDYLNVSQSPEGELPDPPGSEVVTVRGVPARLLDMGNIVLVQWQEGGSRVTVTSDLERLPLLTLLEGLGAVAP